MTSMFWGLRLEPGKRYSTTVDKSFHVSMAALDCSSVKSETDVLSVMLEEESNVPFILCNLQKQKAMQSVLDLNFLTGDRITFFCKGNGVVHLSGFIVPDDEFGPLGDEEGDEEEDEEDDEEEDEELGTDLSELKGAKSKGSVNGVSQKRKIPPPTQQKKKQKTEELQGSDESESDEDEDDDDDEEVEDEGESDDMEDSSFAFGGGGSDEESDDDNEDSEDDDDEDQVQVPPQQQKKDKKKNKSSLNQLSPANTSQNKQQQQQKKQKTPNGIPQNIQHQQATKKEKKKPETPQSGQKLNKSASEEGTPQKKTLEGGVVVKDLKVGNGQICKSGKMVTVYYTGRFKNNNKVFDSTTQGQGFKFRVGKGEVIKGWDVGVVGMKVGGKRMITCPPPMAYGQKGSPPTIPPNSTLMFEVELRNVN